MKYIRFWLMIGLRDAPLVSKFILFVAVLKCIHFTWNELEWHWNEDMSDHIVRNHSQPQSSSILREGSGVEDGVDAYINHCPNGELVWRSNKIKNCLVIEQFPAWTGSNKYWHDGEKCMIKHFKTFKTRLILFSHSVKHQLNWSQNNAW